MRQFLHDHGLGLVSVGVTLACLTCRALTAFHDWDDTSGLAAEVVVVTGEVWPESLIWFLAVMASKRFIEAGSAESRQE